MPNNIDEGIENVERESEEENELIVDEVVVEVERDSSEEGVEPPIGMYTYVMYY